MEIGGYDLVFDHKGMNVSCYDLITLCRLKWREAIVEFDLIEGEFFVYKDSDAFYSWDKCTGEEEYDSQMIYFIMEEDRFTMVVGNPEHEEVKELIVKMKEIYASDKCTCGHIYCVCSIKKAHKKDCKFMLAKTSAVPLECDHGCEVCCICDPCSC